MLSRLAISICALCVLLLHASLLYLFGLPGHNAAVSSARFPQLINALTPVSVALVTPPIALAQPLKSPPPVPVKALAAAPRMVSNAISLAPHISPPAQADDDAIDNSASASALIAAPTQAPTTDLAPAYQADYGHNPPPAYPPLSRRYQEQGVVELRVLVNVAGRVDDAEVQLSSGFARLDQAALKAVKHWQFLLHGGDFSNPEWLVVPVRFALN